MCGVIGVAGKGQCNSLIYNMLQKEQNRGQDTAGIYTYDGNRSHMIRGTGHVTQAIPRSRLEELAGYVGLGQTKYTTTGESTQPVVLDSRHGEIALVHNGNMVNHRRMRNEALKRGISLREDASDSEVFANLLATADLDRSFPRKSLVGAIRQSLEYAGPTYSLIIQNKDKLYAVRDHSGNRPLYYGTSRLGIAVASEARVLELEGYGEIRQVKAGEMVTISSRSSRKTRFNDADYHRCSIELPYFSSAGEVFITNLLSDGKKKELLDKGFQYLEDGALIGEPDPVIFNRNLREARKASGRILARNHGAMADYAAGILGSGLFAAIGYAHESGLDAKLTALMRDPNYNKRNFIMPDGRSKVKGYKLKFIADPNLIDNSSTVLVDDSIWELNTSSGVVELMRLHGARELHLRSATPPILYPCFYGIAVPERKKLIAAQMEARLGDEFIGGVEMLLYLRFMGLDYEKGDLIDMAAEAVKSPGRIEDMIERSFKDGKNFLLGEPTDNHVVRRKDDINLGRFSLDYLTLEEYDEAFGLTSGHCEACMTGDYWGFDTEEEWFIESMRIET